METTAKTEGRVEDPLARPPPVRSEPTLSAATVRPSGGARAHRLDNVQALRAVAVLLVVGRHLQVYAGRTLGGPPIPTQFVVGDMGVDLFFVISGFIMATVHHAPVTRLAGTANFLYRRVSRVYPLYWVWSLPALAVYFWRPDWLHRSSQGMAIDPWRSFLLWPQHDWPLLGQAWSLVYEMYFYVVYAGLLLLPGRWFRPGLLAWAGVVVAGNYLLARLPVLATPETRVVCAVLTLEFIAGALVGWTVRRTESDGRHAVGGRLALGLGAAWIAAGLLPWEMPLTGFPRLLGYGLPSAALVYALTTLEKTGWRAPRFLTKIGDWSYSIYLSHILVIAALAQLVSRWKPHGRAPGILLELGGVAAVLLAGALSFHGLERPLLRMSRRPAPRGPDTLQP